ncbi:MAG: hypothetical protein ABL308_15000 [Oceanicaulis sp.]
MYRLLSYALLAWAAVTLAIAAATIASAGFGVQFPGLEFDQATPGSAGSAGPVGFLIAAVPVTLFVATLLQGAKTVRGLGTISEHWRESTRDLRRLAVLLLAAMVTDMVAQSLINSIVVSREAGAFAVSPVIDITEIGKLLISLIIFLAARALDLAQAEVEENRSFL